MSSHLARNGVFLLVLAVLATTACSSGNISAGNDGGQEEYQAGEDAGTADDGGLVTDEAGPDGDQQAADESADPGPADDGAADGSGDEGGPVTSFSFLFYGDSRSGSDCSGNAVHLALVERMAAEPEVSFVVHLGDMVTGYADSTCFAAPGSCTDSDSLGDLSSIIAPLSRRAAAPGLPAYFFPVIGNHEEGSDWYPDPCGGRICDVFDLTALLDHPTPSSDPCGEDYPDYAYYSFSYGNVAFHVLRVNYDYFDFFECNYPPDGWDSCEQYCREGPRDAQLYERCWNVHQYDWLAGKLQQAAADPRIRHQVIFLHAPVYTSFDDHPPFTSAPVLAELADTYHVALVANGHNHCYERTKPLRQGREDSTGTTYITSSGGGVETWDAAGDWFTAAHSASHHYVRIDVDASGLHGRAIAVDGTVFDSFDID